MEYLTLKDIALINMGQSPDSKTYNEEKEGIPFYQGKSDFGKINPIPRVWCSYPIKIAEKDDILISVRAPIGDTNIATEKCCIGRGLASIRPLNENVNKKYLYYLLNSKYKELNKFGTGSTFKAITKENLCNLKCAEIPDIKEQIEVVKKLDNVSQIIEIKKKQLEELSIIIKSQFVEMFGNENFEKKTLYDITSKITDGSHNPPSGIAENLGYMMLSSQNVINDKINYDNARYLRKEDFEKENARTDLKNGDVLLTIVGTVGRTAIISNEKNITLQRSVAVLKPIKEIKSEYLVGALKSDDVVKQLNKGAKGVAQKGIYLNDLKKLMIPVPPIELQNKFAEFVKQIDKQKFESVIKAEKEIEKIQNNIYYKWGR